jgi:arylsulfatase A-like enzyme
VVDTLRPDRLEWYGAERQTAPSLRPLVEGGALFERAYASQPETTPSIATLLTGLDPAHHGVQHLYTVLHGRNETLAERLAARDYATGAFVSSFVMVRNFSGLDQGFQVYDDFVQEREKYRTNFERRAGQTLPIAARWIVAQGDRPFFCFIHLIDPHGPYDPPPPFDARFRSAEAVEVPGRIPGYQQIPGVTDFNRYVDLYDGEIAYFDHNLRAFLAQLQANGVLDRALVVFTADHGESFGEHGLHFEHGFNSFDENARVPLIVKPPRSAGLPAGVRIGGAVGTARLLATALDLAGFEVPAGLDGASLRDRISGRETAAAAPPAYVQSRRTQPTWARVAGDRKVVFMARRPAQAFDLSADPSERSPIEPGADELAALTAWRDAAKSFRLAFEPRANPMALGMRRRFIDARPKPGDATVLSEEDRERLRSLGYL